MEPGFHGNLWIPNSIQSIREFAGFRIPTHQAILSYSNIFIIFQMVFLPECFDYVGENREQSYSMAAPLRSPRMQRMCDLAKELGVWLSLGGYHEQVCK